MTDGFNSCKNVICNFTEGKLLFLSYFNILHFVISLPICTWTLYDIVEFGFRCYVFISSNTIAT
jgi:hypothetical protein